MSVRLVANVLDYVHGIPHGAKLVLICMADYADDKGKCWPSFQKLSERCDMSRRHVIRVVADLEEMGFLRKVEERPYKPTIYGLTIPTSDTHVTSKSEEVVTPTSLVTQAALVTPMSLTSDTDVTTTSDIAMSPKPPINHHRTTTRGRADYPPEFEAFWANYPKGRGSKKETYALWLKLKPDAGLIEEINQGLMAWLRCERWAVKGMVMEAERWIRGRYWENPPPPAQQPAHRSGVMA